MPIDSTAAWNEIAEFWDERMAEGNQFHLELVAPGTEKLLNLKPGQEVLEIACGNGQFARQMAKNGANVTATDGAEKLINIAKQKTDSSLPITYHVMDATDQKALESLGQNSFDAAVCNMALMDIPDIVPIFKALNTLLKRGAPFVFSVQHPCFNKSGVGFIKEVIEEKGVLKEKTYLKVSNYIKPSIEEGRGMEGQPATHYYFHRPLSMLLDIAFKEGFIVDGFLEPTFTTHAESNAALGWRSVFEIPPVVVVRVRLT